MSDSVRPHRRQPTRLPRPWDSPGKNTGVGCHFLLWCIKVKRESEVAQSCPTLCDPMGCNTPGFPVLHHLPELAQTHVHWIGNAIQPSCPCHPLLLLPSTFSSIRVSLYHPQYCYDLSNVMMICLMGLLIQSWGYADSHYYFLIEYSLWVILLWLHCILCNNMNMPENSFVIHDDFLTHIGRYTSNMIKQDRKLISVNKQMNFQYGNVHMMKSKEGWRDFFN